MISIEVQTQTEIDETIEEFVSTESNIWEALSRNGILSKDTPENIKAAILNKDVEYLGLILYSQIIAYALSSNQNSLDLTQRFRSNH